MTEAGISGTEMAWTSGQAAARRKTLTDAGMERPLAETLVDLLDEQAAPMVTRAEADARFKVLLKRHDEQRAQDRAEADARFKAMLEHHDAQRAQDRAEWKGEMEARFAQVDTRFAELNGEMQARFAQVDSRFAELKGEMDTRFASVEGRIEGLTGQVGTLKWTFGSIMAFNTLLLAVLTYTVAS